MRKVSNILFLTLIALPQWASSQTEPVRVHRYVTDNMASHLYLKLHVPSGELFVQESKECGTAHTKIVSPDTSTKWLLTHTPSPDGNLHQEAVVQASEQRGSSSQATLRQVYRVDPMASQREARAVKSEYCLDPSLSTDLSLYLGHGSSMLDLSNLTLSNLSIESTFSDLVLTYSKPNQTSMQKLHIHAANANIVLKHLEMARASIIHVQNDMGDTKLMLGAGEYSSDQNPVIELRNGVGDCLLLIDSSHPVRIVVDKGVLAKADPGENSGFTKMDNRSQLTFQNKSATELADDKVTMIYCDLDFGELILFSR